MFGGLAFMHHGHMFAGILGEHLVVRVGVEAAECALADPDTAPMDFTGRPLKGYVYVAPAGLGTRKDLRRWLDAGLAFTATLPSKSRARPRADGERARGN